jgi:uncharacterized protein
MSAVQQPPDSNLNRSSLWRLLGCLALILVLGAAIAPVLYWFGKGLLKSLHESGFSSYDQQASHWLWAEIARADFPRFFNRAVLVASVLVLPLYLRGSGMDRSLLPRLKPNGADGLHFGLGFLLAAMLLLELGYLLVKREVYVLKPDAPWLGLSGPLVSALSVAVLEEIIFRGFILGLLMRSMAAGAAIFWTVMIFAVLHFLKPAEGIMPLGAPVEAGTGFWLAGQILAHFGKLDFLLAEFLTLVAVGWALTKARVVTGGLWLSIGLHAGWVFGLKYFSALTKGSRALRTGELLPWLGENLRTGLVSCVIVAFTGWLALQVAGIMRSSSGRNAPPES